MDELMDAMATDESPSQISDKIKEILFNKSAERIDGEILIEPLILYLYFNPKLCQKLRSIKQLI